MRSFKQNKIFIMSMCILALLFSCSTSIGDKGKQMFDEILNTSLKNDLYLSVDEVALKYIRLGEKKENIINQLKNKMLVQIKDEGKMVVMWYEKGSFLNGSNRTIGIYLFFDGNGYLVNVKAVINRLNNL